MKAQTLTVTTIFSALFFFFFFFSQFLPVLSFTRPQCKAWLVQSIPTDMPQLQRVQGLLSTRKSNTHFIICISNSFDSFSYFFAPIISVQIPRNFDLILRFVGLSGDVFVWLAGNSTQRLDIIAQYWELLAGPDDSRSGDFGYSNEDLKKFGANKGYDVYSAIEKAADRNVNVRQIESGFGVALTIKQGSEKEII